MEKIVLKKRTTCPTKNDLYYVRKTYGGYSPCILGRPSLFRGSTLANCTGYVYGRMWEAVGHEVPVGVRPGNTWPGDAENWVEYSRQQGLKISKTPKLGSVACWIHNSKQWGHVAFCEEIYPDGSWLSSESGYDSYYFRNTQYPASGYKSNYQFLGYIEAPVEFVAEEKKPEYKFKIGDQVVVTGKLYKSSMSYSPAGSITNRVTKITRIAEGSKHPYNTTGDLGWMDEDAIQLYEPSKGFKVGDKVEPIKNIDYRGHSVARWDDYYYITELVGNRAVLAADRNGSKVTWCAMNTDNLRKVG